MSFRVLVVPEDIRHDQYLAVPIVQAAVVAAGYSRARVLPCLDPRFQGYSQAANADNLRGVFRKYRGMVDLFVLCLDRDGTTEREAQGETAERTATEDGVLLFSLVAHQEMETWALAGADGFRPAEFGFDSWRAVRIDPDVKERGFEPFARARHLVGALGGGRAELGREAASVYSRRVRRRCPEIAAFEERVRVHRSNEEE